MAKLIGAQRMVLQAILDAQGETTSYIADTKIAEATQIAIKDVRDWLETLEGNEYVKCRPDRGGVERLGHCERATGPRAVQAVFILDARPCPPSDNEAPTFSDGSVRNHGGSEVAKHVHQL